MGDGTNVIGPIMNGTFVVSPRCVSNPGFSTTTRFQRRPGVRYPEFCGRTFTKVSWNKNWASEFEVQYRNDLTGKKDDTVLSKLSWRVWSARTRSLRRPACVSPAIKPTIGSSRAGSPGVLKTSRFLRFLPTKIDSVNDLDPFRLGYFIDGVNVAGHPWAVRGFVSKFAIRTFDVHIHPRGGDPLGVGAKSIFLEASSDVRRHQSAFSTRPGCTGGRLLIR